MEVMRFGKYRGVSVNEVPTNYLEWAQSDMGMRCPSYITEELGKRGVMTGDLWLSRNTPAPKRNALPLTKKQRSREKRKAKSVLRSERQRASSLAFNETLKAGVTITGSDYQRLRDEFDRADGNADECPFDTDDYQYTGPSIVTVDGRAVIVPSEFPKEVMK